MGFVKITSGRLRGRRVRTPAGGETRPLLTRVRKSLADILRPKLSGVYVLDLFGGSGAIVFELLSNGACKAAVVEINPQVAELIRQNAGDLGLAADVEVVHADGIAAVGMLADRTDLFDIIVVAPPYGQDLQRKALEALSSGAILSEDGVIIVQREEGEPTVDVLGTLQRVQTRAYSRTVFDFYTSKKMS